MDDQELLEQARQTLADLTASHDDAVAAVVKYVQERTGEVILVRRPGILDARLQDLFGIENQARAALDAMKTIRRWILPGDDTPLGHRLKIIPADQAELITELLGQAGLL